MKPVAKGLRWMQIMNVVGLLGISKNKIAKRPKAHITILE
jgi:hypothetical protein